MRKVFPGITVHEYTVVPSDAPDAPHRLMRSGWLSPPARMMHSPCVQMLAVRRAPVTSAAARTRPRGISTGPWEAALEIAHTPMRVRSVQTIVPVQPINRLFACSAAEALCAPRVQQSCSSRRSMHCDDTHATHTGPVTHSLHRRYDIPCHKALPLTAVTSECDFCSNGAADSSIPAGTQHREQSLFRRLFPPCECRCALARTTRTQAEAA